MEELQYFIPSRIFLGQGTLARLGGAAEKYGRRALLVSDSVLDDTPLIQRLEDILDRKGIQLIRSAGVETNSYHDLVEDIVSLARASRTEMIIGMGGIRALSIAKVSSVMVRETRRMDDIMDGFPVTAAKLPYIEVPTTCRNPFMLNTQSLLLDSRNRRNRILEITGVIPDVVIMDPQLSATLSEKYVISTLLDTFLYALEGYLSLKNNFLSDSLFLKSISLVDSALDIMGDPQHNEEFLDKSFQAGLSAAVGLSMSRLGAGSGAAFAVSGRFGVPKSLVASMMIPAVLEYGAAAATDKLARIAGILDTDTRGLDPARAAMKAVEIMRIRLGRKIGELRIPHLKIKKDEMTDLAEFVHTYPMIKDMPGALSSKDIQDMIRRVL